MSTKAILRHLTVETPHTNHRRECAAHRKGPRAHFIRAGETHLVVAEDKTYRYCVQSAGEVLDKAQQDLATLKQQLGI